MIRIARNVVTDRCERCGRLVLLSVARDKTGRQLFWCERCIATYGTEGLTDLLKDMQ
jgi:hypothetical protein